MVRLDVSWFARAAVVVALLAIGHAQVPPGVSLPVPPLAAGPFEFVTAEQQQRIRDVRQGPDGLLDLLTDEDNGALLRIEPVP